MTAAAQGASVTLVAQFYAYPSGPAADVTGLTITLKTPAGAVEIGPTGVGIAHPAVGVYTYVWAVSAGAVLGDHLALWQADGGVSTSELVTITATASVTWCTVADVLNLTGVTVDGPQLTRAQGVIETFVDIDPSLVTAPATPTPANTLQVRDRVRLTRACAYQAGWMFEQIDVTARTDITQLSQDGASFTYANPHAVVLAPLAKRNIDRLSWNQSGPVGKRRSAAFADMGAWADGWLRDDPAAEPGGWILESPHL